MIHDPLSGSSSSASQVTRFSPATLLWRAALGAGQQDALVSADRRVSYRELAERLACARASHVEAGLRGRLLGRGARLDDVLGFCEALTHTVPLYSADLLPADSLPRGLGAITARRECQPRPRNFTIDGAEFDAMTLVRLLSESHGLGWTSEALSYCWGMAAPLPGTVGVLTGPVGAPISWAAVFGVLLGRGRVVVPESDLPESMDLLSREGVGELHLRLEQARGFIARTPRPCATVKRVCVWHEGAVPIEELHALAPHFPSARISRVLAWAGGPIALATLAQLEAHGDGFLGTRSLGSRLTVSPNGTLIIEEAPWLPVDVGGPAGTSGRSTWDTGILVDAGGDGRPSCLRRETHSG